MSINDLQPKSTAERAISDITGFNGVAEANEYDIILSFFVDQMIDQEAAENFTSAIFQVAHTTGERALDLIESMRGKDKETLLLMLAYYMNTVRSRSTLIGVAPQRLPNYYAARNVLP
jgi:hypothetical protein